ncbi:MAG: type II secretion system F family protein [Chloroflexota bacterium]|nr:type II secretion system F family protein [Chloroflexota bacterium]MDE3192475.1 type II secretion system F family protein [Chloroflexota bacterium]
MEYALPAGLAVSVLLVFGGIYTLLTSGVSIDERLARYAGNKAVPEKREKSQKRQRAEVDVAVLTADVEDKRFAMRVARDLARANLKLKVAEYYYIRIGLAIGLGLVLGVMRDPVSGVAGVVIGYFAPRFWVGRRIGGRLGAFNKQLPDTITLLSNSLRAGSSFLQSTELVSRETPPPMGEEMGRVVREVNLGLGMEEALLNMVRRIKSEDLDLMVTAISIQQQVGGNLAEILDTIAFTIRERVRIKGEVNTLTAQGRYSGYLVAMLPIGIAFMINLISPAFMEPLFKQTIGQILLVTAGIMMAIGFFAIRKITDIKI